MEIIKASIGDAEEILKVQKAAYKSEGERYNDNNIDPLIETLNDIKEQFKTHIFLKAVFDGKLVGSVRAYEKDGTCYIGRLAVLPEMHNKGIGTALMGNIEGCFKSYRFELFTGAKTPKNIMLYQKLGYSIYKKEQYGCGNIKVVYMEKFKKKQDE